MRLRFVLLFLVVAAAGRAQDFSGYRSGKYTGVNGVFFNPANIAGTGYKYDVNIVNVSATVANNQSSFKLSDIGNSFNGDSLLNRIFPRNNDHSSSLVSTAVIGPSVMIALNRKSAFAITTRARAMMNGLDIDNKLARQLINDLDEFAISYPYTIASANKMLVTANGWTEIGASYARTLLENNKHVLKGGVSVKYLAGAANAYLNVSDLNATVNNTLVFDPYLTNTRGNIGLGFGGINVGNFKVEDLFSFQSAGVGADVGFTYELMDEKGEDGYRLKAGVAVTDIGSITYNRDQSRSGAFSMNIPNGQRFNLSELSGTSIENIKSTFRRFPQYFTENTATNTSSYAVSLPTTLQLTADYHYAPNFYVNAAAQIAMTKASSNGYNSQYYNAVSITPRYENRTFSFFLPLAYNSLAKFTAGFGLRAGPLFVGSGSLFTALFNSSKQVDAMIGLRFGGWMK